ncbi:MAG TPA: LysM peptidoglycan-binding domain-containing protein [Candidatus Dormibacteraeota bacterium]|nr:LysM peptidoglycan-binding domain-containing protein [Candidatus Saccharimonadales bacterium]HXJ72421.1 LysM peptidoglycan-binding domain-containing protein [Candidatus Dormibacteraeota bacterium]
MNTPNPLVPQGTFADKGKSQIRITFFAIIAVHVVLLGLLLIAGCNKKPTDQAQDTGMPPVPPPVEAWPPTPTSAPPAQVADTLTPPGTVPPPVLPPGTSALTPPPPTAPDTVPPAGLSEHTISKGDSFYTIGKKYGVGYKAIVEANPGLNPNRLKIGDKVKVPGAKAAAPGTGATATAAPVTGEAARTYKVKSGDNLMKIAKANGVSVKQLRTANNLKTDQIKVGQTLKIPAKAAPAMPEAAAVPPVQPPPLVPPPGNQ